MQKQEILIIEDELNLREGLKLNFEMEGFSVRTAQNGAEGLEFALQHPPDLILLDVGLPKKDGISVCKELRSEGLRIPILMLTARTSDGDKITGLEAGADDYITKPFSLEELFARVRAFLRRMDWGLDGRTSSQSPFVVDHENLTVLHFEKVYQLTSQELRLLTYFIEHEGKVINRSELLQEVWGYGPNASSRTVDAFMNRLRKYFEDENHQYFESIRGVGYRFSQKE